MYKGSTGEEVEEGVVEMYVVVWREKWRRKWRNRICGGSYWRCGRKIVDEKVKKEGGGGGEK